MSKIVDLSNAERVGKGYLIDALVKDGQSRPDAEESVNSVLDAIGKALASGVNVSLSNIGTLRVETAAARVRRNPKTGETFHADAHQTVRWTVSPTLVDVLNGRSDRDTLATKAPKSH